MSARILLVDDHTIFRQGLHALLAMNSDFEVVGEAGTGQGALEEIGRLQPDAVIMDIELPDMSGLEATRLIRKRMFHTRILILSAHDDEHYVTEAFRNGANGYALKFAGMEVIKNAIETIISGQTYLCPGVTERVISSYVHQSIVGTSPTTKLNTALTEREKEVIMLAAQGHTSADIANRLFISHRTVETHRANAMRKLNLHSQAELFQYAVDSGLVTVNTNSAKDL